MLAAVGSDPRLVLGRAPMMRKQAPPRRLDTAAARAWMLVFTIAL
jgi:hypothetical protein